MYVANPFRFGVRSCGQESLGLVEEEGCREEDEGKWIGEKPVFVSMCLSMRREEWKNYRLVAVGPVRQGVWECTACRKQITVTVEPSFNVARSC